MTHTRGLRRVVAVVQEFLWLKADVKNAHYKSAVHDFLVRGTAAQSCTHRHPNAIAHMYVAAAL